MSSSKDLVVEPSPLGSLKGLNGTKDTEIILVRPLTLKVKAYVQLRWYDQELNRSAWLSI